MAAATTIETRLRVELERRYLLQPGELPDEVVAEHAAYPALAVKDRWGVVRAADLIALLQPWTERDAVDGDSITKVAGARYSLLIGVIDEPWVRVLVGDMGGRLSTWRGRVVDDPLLTVTGSEEELARLALPRSADEIAPMLRRSTALGAEADWMTRSILESM